MRGHSVTGPIDFVALESPATPEWLIGWCRERLAHYKCPISIDITDALPRNPTGKILKKDLRQPFWEGQQRQVN